MTAYPPPGAPQPNEQPQPATQNQPYPPYQPSPQYQQQPYQQPQPYAQQPYQQPQYQQQPQAYQGPPPPATYVPPAPWGEPMAPVGAYPANPPNMVPPPPMTKPITIEVPPVAWAIPVAAVLAVIGAFTPWFDPTAVRDGQNVLEAGGALYSWRDGRIGLVAPIALVGLSVMVVSASRGVARGYLAGTHNPVGRLAKTAIGVALATGVALAIAWFLVPGQYHFNSSQGRLSWSDLEDMGFAMGRGPQLGFFLTIAAAVVALLAGVAALVSTKQKRI